MGDISTALTIPGWMTPAELQWLADQSLSAQVIVEIGSYRGRSTRALADNAPGKLVAIDDWYGPRDTIIPHSERLKILEDFKANLSTSQVPELVIWKIDHQDITPEAIQSKLGPDFKADLIFIDGAHDYDSVYRDISTWLPFLSENGTISGHDYELAYCGLVQAVNELIPGPTVPEGTSIWKFTMSGESKCVQEPEPATTISTCQMASLQ